MVSKQDREWFDNPERGAQIYLPSFERRIDLSDPLTVSTPKGQGGYELAVDSGDAFSASYSEHPERNPGGAFDAFADNAFQELDIGYLRRILLIILSEEEHGKVFDYHRVRKTIDFKDVPEGTKMSFVERIEVVEKDDPYSQVRLTDLRMAKDISTADLKNEAKSTFSSLPSSYSADGVRHWKWKTLREYKTPLKKPEEWTEQERKRELTRVKAVSFSAAALLLLRDLNASKLSGASGEELVTYVCELRKLISDLQQDLDKAAEKMRKLFLGRGSRPPDPGFKYYKALHLYRMGMPLKDIASEIGINPARRVDGQFKGSKDWKNKLREALRRGVEVEKERFPIATEAFDNRSDETVRQLASDTYNDFQDMLTYDPWNLPDYINPSEYYYFLYDSLVGRSVNERAEFHRALVQLGSCIVNDIPVFPDF